MSENGQMTATVAVLTAEVHVLKVGSRQITRVPPERSRNLHRGATPRVLCADAACDFMA